MNSNGKIELQDCVQELKEATLELSRAAAGWSVADFDRNRILDYARHVNSLHAKLSKNYDPSEGRSKIIDRFFEGWNNMVLGVFYTSDILNTDHQLTERQFEILITSLDEIISYADKFPRH